jgi:hypothetical protein
MFPALILFGCFRRSPHNSAERYVESLKQFNYVECYRLLSRRDHAERSFPKFLTEIPLAPDVGPIWFKPILQATHFELYDEHLNPDSTSAEVPVRITAIDLPLWERTVNATATAGQGHSLGQVAHLSLVSGKYPTVVYDDVIFLVKEGHQWRVNADFAGRDLILERRRQALRNFYEGRVDEALSQYRSMLAELGGQSGTGNLGLVLRLRKEMTAIQQVKAQTPVATAYDAKLKLDGVAMRMADERVPAILGEITNAGDHPIDELRLAVTWYQQQGKNLRFVQREDHPVIVTPIEFTDFTRQVVPFMPGDKRRFGFILNAPPEVQQSSTPYVTIASLAFPQITAPLSKLTTPIALENTNRSDGHAASSAGPPATSALAVDESKLAVVNGDAHR